MSAFELLRDRISVHEVIERCTEVEGSKARCVSELHPEEDDHPCMHLDDNHVHCFSCGFHTDATGEIVDAVRLKIGARP